MYIISRKFTCKPGAKEKLLVLVSRLIEPSRLEVGCINYSFYEDQFSPGVFLFYEEWQSREAIDAHFSKPYFVSFMEQFPVLIEGKPEIKICKVSAIEEL